MRERNTSNFWQWLVSNPPFCQMCHDCFKSEFHRLKKNVGSSLTFAAWRANSNSIKKYDVIHDLMTYSFHFRLPLFYRYQGNVLSYFFNFILLIVRHIRKDYVISFRFIFFIKSFWRTFFSLDTKKLFSNRRLDYFYFPVFVFVFFLLCRK